MFWSCRFTVNGWSCRGLRNPGSCLVNWHWHEFQQEIGLLVAYVILKFQCIVRHPRSSCNPVGFLEGLLVCWLSCAVWKVSMRTYPASFLLTQEAGLYPCSFTKGATTKLMTWAGSGSCFELFCAIHTIRQCPMGKHGYHIPIHSTRLNGMGWWGEGGTDMRPCTNGVGEGVAGHAQIHKSQTNRNLPSGCH